MMMIKIRKIGIRDDGGSDIITYFLANFYSVCRQQHRRKIPVLGIKMSKMTTLMMLMMMVVQMTTEVKAEEETLASQPAH